MGYMDRELSFEEAIEFVSLVIEYLKKENKTNRNPFVDKRISNLEDLLEILYELHWRYGSKANFLFTETIDLTETIPSSYFLMDPQIHWRKKKRHRKRKYKRTPKIL